jgi:hypothetical protein
MTKAVRVISPSLVQSYRKAIYLIHAQGEDIVMKVGKTSPQLSALMQSRKVASAAFITAFNPFSSALSTHENELRHRALLSDLTSLGLELLSGEGRDCENLWPSETSVLALGISLETAELLAKRYEQNAFIWIPSNEGLVELNLLLPVSSEAPINGG